MEVLVEELEIWIHRNIKTQSLQKERPVAEHVLQGSSFSADVSSRRALVLHRSRTGFLQQSVLGFLVAEFPGRKKRLTL